MDMLRHPTINHACGRMTMPEKQTIKKAQKTKRARKAPPTKAGEFAREEIHKNSSWRARGQIIAAARTEEHGVARGPSRVRATPQRTASPMPMIIDRIPWDDARAAGGKPVAFASVLGAVILACLMVATAGATLGHLATLRPVTERASLPLSHTYQGFIAREHGAAKPSRKARMRDI
jgi:hypothetical protein